MTRKGDDRADHAMLARRLHASLARACAEDARCTLLIVRPLAATSGNVMKRAAPGAGDLALLARRLHVLVRDTDEIHVDVERGIAIVLHDTGIRGGHVVMDRLAEALDASALPRPGAFAPGRRQNAPWKLAMGCSEVTRLDLTAPERLTQVVARAWRSQQTIAPSLPLRRVTIPPAVARDLAVRFTYPPRQRTTSAPLIGASARSPEKARSTPLIQGQTRRTPRLRLIRGGKPRCSEETMRQRAQALGVPFLRLPRRLSGAGWHGISVELAHELRAVPVGCSRHVLTVAMDNPRDVAAVLRLRAITGLAIFPVLALPEELDRALEQIAE
jgi:hypothetical protein